MKLTTPLVALALALAGSAASAATIGVLYDAGGNPIANGADLGPDLYSAVQADIQPTYTSSFDYVYNFMLDSTTDLNVSANTYLGPTVDGSASFSLYNGTSTGDSGTPGALAGTVFTFGGTIVNTTFSGLPAGTYFFEIAGSPATMIGTAFNVTLQAPGDTGPLPAVPEPANMALLLAGLGLMGFLVKRRARD
ncbi:PEP-CTERM sorting domain-containing protein [Scleromatobacter humisilvae]|uniref:PEP-CTERM sorting domain-containing protein n=1 Tax=Scleromatobacter humisilvae TaxID=2897159 RepID=A0A9X2BZX3_9BURK|nr:PEP-CTERM sorting domain-containing protein [Scleromatobacter humisilvae]MCK9685816.1 PEP-CTERM sorting domain-containing protein [Scleromatobacter humisilvae]